MRHQIILSIGSNENGEQQLKLAEAALHSMFKALLFSKVVATIPIDYPRNTLFYNQVAIGQTESTYETVAPLLKKIEQNLGRTPEKEKDHRIPIDIDLIQWDDWVIKPTDLKRDYIQSGLKELEY